MGMDVRRGMQREGAGNSPAGYRAKKYLTRGKKNKLKRKGKSKLVT